MQAPEQVWTAIEGCMLGLAVRPRSPQFVSACIKCLLGSSLARLAVPEGDHLHFRASKSSAADVRGSCFTHFIFTLRLRSFRLEGKLRQGYQQGVEQ